MIYLFIFTFTYTEFLSRSISLFGRCFKRLESWHVQLFGCCLSTQHCEVADIDLWSQKQRHKIPSSASKWHATQWRLIWVWQVVLGYFCISSTVYLDNVINMTINMLTQTSNHIHIKFVNCRVVTTGWRRLHTLAFGRFFKGVEGSRLLIGWMAWDGHQIDIEFWCYISCVSNVSKLWQRHRINFGNNVNSIAHPIPISKVSMRWYASNTTKLHHVL